MEVWIGPQDQDRKRRRADGSSETDSEVERNRSVPSVESWLSSGHLISSLQQLQNLFSFSFSLRSGGRIKTMLFSGFWFLFFVFCFCFLKCRVVVVGPMMKWR